MNEQDTFNRLRRVPYDELYRRYDNLSQDRIDEIMGTHTEWFEDQDDPEAFGDAFYEYHGWTYEEFYKEMRKQSKK